MKTILKKFFNTPGLMSLEELDKAKEFLLKYQEIRDIYLSASGSDPIGLTIESHLEKIDWYINFKTGK